VRRLPERRRTRLENFLMLFNQAWCTEENYILDLQEIPEGFADMAEYLQRPLMDEAFRRTLEAEEEIDTIFDAQEAKYLKKIAEAEAREKKAREGEKLERKQKETERRQKESLALKLATYMKQRGADIEDIIKQTGLAAETIIDL
ncbi:MAG: hypothetical protein PHX39_13490, partial [Bacteroidales bacterium]|nr:hypothetical protein [Bacteroidales bacterium]